MNDKKVLATHRSDTSTVRYRFQKSGYIYIYIYKTYIYIYIYIKHSCTHISGISNLRSVSFRELKGRCFCQPRKENEKPVTVFKVSTLGQKRDRRKPFLVVWFWYK